MTFPEWTKPGAYGALLGAGAIGVLGFTMGGWTTAGAAQDMARDHAIEQVVLAMLPICLDASATDPESAAKLAELGEASSWNRTRAMMATGWATHPGSDEPSRELAAACIEALELDGS